MTTTRILPIPPTALLKAVHDRMKELFVRYLDLAPDATWAKTALYHVIRDMLGAHMKIEETLFYPAVQEVKSDLAISVILKGFRDHEQVKVLLEELKVLTAGRLSLDDKMGELQFCVVAHLLLEETEIFPHAQLIPPETLGKLSDEMTKLQERLKGSSSRLERPPGEPRP